MYLDPHGWDKWFLVRNGVKNSQTCWIKNVSYKKNMGDLILTFFGQIWFLLYFSISSDRWLHISWGVKIHNFLMESNFLDRDTCTCIYTSSFVVIFCLVRQIEFVTELLWTFLPPQTGDYSALWGDAWSLELSPLSVRATSHFPEWRNKTL